MHAVLRTRFGFGDLLPTGSALPDDAWRKRHLALSVLLILHIPGIAIYGVATGNTVWHSSLEASIVALFAIGAAVPGMAPRARAAMTTVGLVASSGILVHLSGGLIEMHFHFFIMVAVVTLYQDWIPFLLAIGFVVLHHGSMGVLDVTSVYNHPDAMRYPWKWAAIHGLFITGQSIACLAAWKVNELGMERERKARIDLERANLDLAEAQSMSHLGSWEWDIPTNRVLWSDELYRICGVAPESFNPTYEGFIGLLHPGDKERIEKTVADAFENGADFHYEARILRPDGDIRTVDATGKVSKDGSGVVARIAGTLQDVSARRTLEEQVEYQAFHDSLTGLANRALFHDRVQHALVRRARQNVPLAVLFLDLDDFKTVNDSLGHRAGDELLIAVAERIQGVLRSIDTVARLGGDEFAVLLEDLVENDEAIKVTGRILELLRHPFEIEGHELFVHASIGIAYASDYDPVTPGDILRDADTAMYVTKNNGKNGFRLFEQEMQTAARDRLTLKASLQRAVEKQEFVVNYQPIVGLEDGEIIGAEALVRWMSPERGLVPPLDFIPFAEETGLILPISRLVLEMACTQAAAWQAIKPLQIAVNISAVSLRRAGFVDEVTTVLLASGLPPEMLTLEITESVLVQDQATVKTRLLELRELGVKLALDDFGTGYSSLSYLKEFPIDVIKIDKSFIDSVSLGPEESALARAVIKLGQELEMKVVAEGVEQLDQASTLHMLNCAFAQGYLFSRPVDVDALSLLLQADGRRLAGNGSRAVRSPKNEERVH